MKSKSVVVLLTVAVLAMASAIPAQASQYKVIYTFLGGTDGETPEAELVSDSSGNLYGTTEFGGSQKWGTVFKLAPSAGGAWTESVLYAFSDGSDGGQPVASLTLDAAGNLYGTTSAGGDATCIMIYGFCGVVFELTPNPDGTWSETVLHNFTGPDGRYPQAGVIFDGSGNLYGTTTTGGALGYGTVYELSPNGDGTWSESVLYSFGQKAAGANSKLIFDSAGNLYGTTASGGYLTECAHSGCGTVFELTQSGGTWSSQTLYRFTGRGGANPVGVVFDSAGNLFGAAPAGGVGSCYGLVLTGCGVDYELVPVPGSAWQAKEVRVFAGTYAGAPNPVIVDSAGNVYGTGRSGGSTACSFGCGAVYELAHTSGGTWNLVKLYEFTGGANGNWPYAGLYMDSAGNLYGTTGAGGDLSCESSGGCGVVFQIIP